MAPKAARGIRLPVMETTEIGFPCVALLAFTPPKRCRPSSWPFLMLRWCVIAVRACPLSQREVRFAARAST